jgi:hypothetical protein
MAEELRIPGAFKLYFLANRDFPNIPDCHIKAYAIKRDVKKINLNIIAVTNIHQDLASLLLSLRQTTVKASMGNLAAFMTSNGSSSNLIGDRHHSFPLTGMTFEVYPSTGHPECLCFGHNVSSICQIFSI